MYRSHDEGVAVAAEHIRHFRSRPTHFVRPLRRAMARSAWSGWESGTAADPNGLVVAQTLLVAIRRYILAVVLRLLWPISN